MTAPIQKTSSSFVSPSGSRPTAALVPAGVGTAPTRLEQTRAVKKEGPGHFERFVLKLRDRVLSLFHSLFKKSGEASLPVEAPKTDPRIGQAKILLDQLRNGVMPFDLSNQFQMLFSEEEQRAVYKNLGEAVPMAAGENWTHWSQNAIDARHIEKGRAMVKNNPTLLVASMIIRLSRMIG